ncbi:hypothetical protein BG004_008325 [Podila humilis]|nr:hypothetical protein BG004_008325 [Podila humilis]
MSDAPTTPVATVQAQLAELTVAEKQKKLTILDDLGSDDDSDDEDYVAEDDDSDSEKDSDDSSSSSSSSGEDDSDSDKEDEIEGDEVAALAQDASAHGAALNVENKVLRTGKVIKISSTEKAVETTVVSDAQTSVVQ